MAIAPFVRVLAVTRCECISELWLMSTPAVNFCPIDLLPAKVYNSVLVLAIADKCICQTVK